MSQYPSHPALQWSGYVVGGDHGFSTLRREIAGGQLFSTGLGRAQAALLPPGFGAMAPMGGGAQGVLQSRPLLQLSLFSSGFPPNALCLPGGPAEGAQGTLEVLDDPPAVALQVQDLKPLPGDAARYVAWLISDLIIPADLDPRDLAALPRQTLVANQPGGPFTIDGLPSAVGRADLPMWNTVAVAVPAGAFMPTEQATFAGRWPFTADINWSLDPTFLLGSAPPGAGSDPRLPSRLAADILSDVFLRPVTIFPGLPPTHALSQRLQAVRQGHLSRFGGDGRLTPAAVAGRDDAFLPLAAFNRVAVTLEPVQGRTTPKLLPTQQNCVLVGLSR